MFKKKRDRVRVVIAGGLGDHLLITPFLRFLKVQAGYEIVECVAMESARELFELNPFVDRIIPCRSRDIYFWSLPEADYDIFSPYFTVRGSAGEDPFKLEPAYNFNLNRHDVFVVKQIADYFGMHLDTTQLEVFTAPEDERWAHDFSNRRNGKKWIYVNRHSHQNAKNYPDDLWQQVFSGLEKAGKGKIAFLERGQDGLCPSNFETIALAIGLRRFIALAKLFDCILTIDSFAGHLAAAVGVTAIVLFGPSNAITFGHNENRNIRSSACPVCADSERFSACRNYQCLKRIDPETIINEAMGILF
jgi:ADP-heptose:LPS heptosyltransferase